MWDGLDEKTGRRVIRGGSWLRSAEYCSVAYRHYDVPEFRNVSLCFRVALSSVP
jgi:formylglycine-generating enzyme required for sulfatase activity